MTLLFSFSSAAQQRIRPVADQEQPRSLSFEQNRGQAAADVQFLVNGGSRRLLFLADHAILEMTVPERGARRGPLTQKSLESRRLKRARVEMKFRGSRQVNQPQLLDELPGKVNYLRGNDPSKWLTGIPTYSRLLYRDVYPEIDLIYYGNDGALEYDFIARPGADTSQIEVEFSGAKNMRVSSDGDLQMDTDAGVMRWKKPYVYQDEFGKRKQIEGRYRLRDGRVGFELGARNPALPVVIDPVLEYATYFGGSDVELGGAFSDATGIYIAGTTYSTDMPVTGGSFDGFLNGTYDVFVSKLNPAGNNVIFTTYLGGGDLDALDSWRLGADGSIYIAGFTTSFDFPTTAGDYDRSYSGGVLNPTSDGFVARLNSSGTGLLWSTYLGGTARDVAFDLRVDSTGSVFVAGNTDSTDFPVTNQAYQSVHAGGNDLFVTKFNAAGSLVYSTFLGGSGDELLDNSNAGPEPPQIVFGYANSIAVDSAGNVYITGVTSSANFPTTPGALSRTHAGGGADCYVTKLNSSGSGLAYSTFCGGSGFDAAGGIHVDASGAVTLAGITYSNNLTTTTGAFSRTYSGAGDAFLMRLNAAGSALLYSTYFGGSGEESWATVSVSPDGTMLLSGFTHSTNLPVTAGTFQSAAGGNGDVYLAVFSSPGALADCSYFGGSGLDLGAAVFGVDSNEILASGRTDSTNLPTTVGAYRRQRNGTAFDAFVAKFRLGTANCAYSLSATSASFTATGGTGSVAMTANCAWNAASDSAWVTITSGASGSGNGTINYTVSANTSAQARTATITAGGQTLIIQQAGLTNCTYTLSGTSVSVGSSSATVSIIVTTTAGCTWNASSNSSFLTILSGANGTGSGTVSLSIGTNTGAARVGTVTIAGQTYTVTQSAGNGGGGGSGSSALVFFPVTPCRVADTRNAAGQFGGPTMAGNSTRTFNVPQSACSIPATAQAYSVNITVVPTGALGFLTVWPAEQGRPLVSTLNSFQGFIVANAAIVPAGTSGGISVFVTDRTDVIIDINGYFAPLTQAGGLRLYPATPCRIADTRNANGPFGGPQLEGGQTRSFGVPQSPCGIPSGAQAYSLNFTVVPSGPLGFLSTWPTGQPRPLVSTLNSFQGLIVANAGLVPAGTGGAIDLFATDRTHAIIDVNGYFAP